MTENFSNFHTVFESADDVDSHEKKRFPPMFNKREAKVQVEDFEMCFVLPFFRGS